VHLTDTNGDLRSVDLRIGRDVADSRLNPPGAPSQRTPEVAYQFARVDPTAYRYGEQLYYARRPVLPSFTATSVTIENLVPGAGLEIFGIGLFNAVTGEITQAREKQRFQPIYRDDQVRIFENTGTLPRAFLVPSATVVAPGQDALSRMLDGPFNPRETVFVECAPPDPLCGLPLSLTQKNLGQLDAPGVAVYRSYESDASTIQVTAVRDAMLVVSDRFAPGWIALVDDRPTPILRADYLFRAIHVPAGSHTVRVLYAPWAIGIGALVSAVTISCVFLVTGVHALTAAQRRWAWKPWPRWRRATEPAAVPELS
jgi:hypothetical protein